MLPLGRVLYVAARVDHDCAGHHDDKTDTEHKEGRRPGASGVVDCAEEKWRNCRKGVANALAKPGQDGGSVSCPRAQINHQNSGGEGALSKSGEGNPQPRSMHRGKVQAQVSGSPETGKNADGR